MKIKPTNFSRLVEPSRNTDIYPEFSLSLKQFPMAKDWKVGEKYHLELTVRQSRMSQGKGNDGSVTFEILEIEGETPEEDMNEEEEGADEEEETPGTYSRINK